MRDIARKIVEEGIPNILESKEKNAFVFAWARVRVVQVSANEWEAGVFEAQGFKEGRVARMLMSSDNVIRFYVETTLDAQEVLKVSTPNWFSIVRLIRGTSEVDSSGGFTTFIKPWAPDGSTVEVGFMRGDLWRDTILRRGEELEIKLMGVKAF